MITRMSNKLFKGSQHSCSMRDCTRQTPAHFLTRFLHTESHEMRDVVDICSFPPFFPASLPFHVFISLMFSWKGIYNPIMRSPKEGARSSAPPTLTSGPANKNRYRLDSKGSATSCALYTAGHLFPGHSNTLRESVIIDPFKVYIMYKAPDS